MSTQIILKVLALRQRDRWMRRQLEARQAKELRLLRVQRRAVDVLRFPATSGGEVAVQPIVFHCVMDGVPAGGWQVAQGPDGLTVPYPIRDQVQILRLDQGRAVMLVAENAATAIDGLQIGRRRKELRRR